MMKYVLALIIIIIGILFYINKNQILSKYADDNYALTAPGSADYTLRITHILPTRGSISPSSTTKYPRNTIADIYASPRRFYKVVWSGACSGNNNVCKIFMNSDKQLYVGWAPKGGRNCRVTVLPQLAVICDW